MTRSRSTRRWGVRATLAAIAVAGLLAASAVAANADPDPSNPGTPIAGLDPAQLWAGVGADAFAELTNNLANSYNATVTSGSPELESFDAVNPQTGAAGENIETKPGCTVARPNGANAGMTLLEQNLKSTAPGYTDQYCVDFVRSSRARNPATDSNETFYAQSGDAVGYATVGNAYAPTAPLTTQELKDIFDCVDTDWSQVGGQAGAIHVYLPPSSSATLTFFLQAIGTTLNNVQTGCGTDTFAQQQNDGRSMNGDPQGIAPYAITKWAAQENADLSTGAPAGISDYRGGTDLGLVNSTVAPTTTSTYGGQTYSVLNPAFSAANPSYARLLYNVVRLDAPSGLVAIFQPGGYLCSNEDEFLVPFGNTPLGTDQGNGQPYCGQTS